MRTIRASEIATFMYCRRAWWYHTQGIESANQAELAGGSEYHRQHGRHVLQAQLLRTGGYVLLAIALIVLVVWITLELLPT